VIFHGEDYNVRQSGKLAVVEFECGWSMIVAFGWYHPASIEYKV
jgi:hypothetical protein